MKLKFPLLVLVLTLAQHVLFAQYHISPYGPRYRMHRVDYNRLNRRSKKAYQRKYEGIGISLMSLDLQHRYDNLKVDTMIKLKLTGKPGYTYCEGVFYPFTKKETVEDAFGLDVSILAQINFYDIKKIVYYGDEYAADKGVSLAVAMPIGLCYKSGGDVSLDQKKNFMFGFGGGVAPGYAITHALNANLAFTARPFVEAEVGYFAKLAWKLKVMAYIGDVTLVNEPVVDYSDANESSISTDALMSTHVTGKTNVLIMLMVMPHSWRWGEFF